MPTSYILNGNVWVENGRRCEFVKHLNMFNQLLDQLYKVDVKVEKENKALLLLTSLPNSYNNSVTLLIFGKDIVSLEDIMTLLLSND